MALSRNFSRLHTRQNTLCDVHYVHISVLSINLQIIKLVIFFAEEYVTSHLD